MRRDRNTLSQLGAQVSFNLRYQRNRWHENYRSELLGRQRILPSRIDRITNEFSQEEGFSE